MKTPIAYIGNALDASAWRLAGAQVFTPDAGGQVQALAQALRNTDVVLLEAQVAQQLPLAVLEAALAQVWPLVAIVPDTDVAPLPIDPPERVRRQLGLDSAPQAVAVTDLHAENRNE